MRTNFGMETPEETIARLTIYSQRLRASVTQAKILYVSFQSLNGNPDLRETVNGTPARTATNLIMHAVLRELIMILVRVFDKAGHNGIMRSDKVTFPIVAEWIARVPIHDLLIEKARVWFPDGYRADENVQTVESAIGDLNTRLNRITSEDPNREKLLRDFRDGFLAHELHRQVELPGPMFGHIGGMLEEIRLLSESASMVIEGTDIAWDNLDHDVMRSADWLWKRVGSG